MQIPALPDFNAGICFLFEMGVFNRLVFAISIQEMFTWCQQFVGD